VTSIRGAPDRQERGIDTVVTALRRLFDTVRVWQVQDLPPGTSKRDPEVPCGIVAR
jgi:hypothetical protein